MASAVNALLALADREPGQPSGHVLVHPDEIMEIITRHLTAPTEAGCGCLRVDDEQLVTHIITDPCGIHGAAFPSDFYGSGFWAAYHGDSRIDPEALGPNDRADWDAGFAAAAIGEAAVRPR